MAWAWALSLKNTVQSARLGLGVVGMQWTLPVYFEQGHFGCQVPNWDRIKTPFSKRLVTQSLLVSCLCSLPGLLLNQNILLKCPFSERSQGHNRSKIFTNGPWILSPFGISTSAALKIYPSPQHRHRASASQVFADDYRDPWLSWSQFMALCPETQVNIYNTDGGEMSWIVLIYLRKVGVWWVGWIRPMC